jgi:hypothetical protein
VFGWVRYTHALRAEEAMRRAELELSMAKAAAQEAEMAAMQARSVAEAQALSAKATADADQVLAQVEETLAAQSQVEAALPFVGKWKSADGSLALEIEVDATYAAGSADAARVAPRISLKVVNATQADGTALEVLQTNWDGSTLSFVLRSPGDGNNRQLEVASAGADSLHGRVRTIVGDVAGEPQDIELIRDQ